MGALLSSYRRGSRLALDSLAWLLGSRTVAALRLDPRPFSCSASVKTRGRANDRWLEEEFVCPCYYTENFYIKKASDDEERSVPLPSSPPPL